jgi:hypothetical protein
MMANRSRYLGLCSRFLLVITLVVQSDISETLIVSIGDNELMSQ